MVEYINTALLGLLVTIGAAAVGFAVKHSGLLQRVLTIMAALQRRGDEHDNEIEALKKGQTELRSDVGYLRGRLDEREK